MTKLEAALECAKDSLEANQQLPCRVDEMTEREHDLFKMVSDLYSSLRVLNEETVALRNQLSQLCEDHVRVGAIYERGGNTRGAMQLRAVGNMLGYILQGGENATTVLPDPEKVAGKK